MCSSDLLSDTNDSGQSAFSGNQVYQVSCNPDTLFYYIQPLNLQFVGFYQHSAGWGPTGIAIRGNQAFIISASLAQLEIRNTDNLDQIINSYPLDTTTYGEHDGICFAPNNHLFMATMNGYIVEMSIEGNYIHNWLIDSTKQFRGASIKNGYLVTCDVADQLDNSHTNIYILNYPTINVLDIIDFSSYLNTVGNRVYGSFFIKSSAVKL